jgi:hypothetical protein
MSEKIVEFVIKTLLPEAKKYDEPFRKNRLDNRKFYKGDQWRKPKKKGRAHNVSNFLSVSVRDETALLTDNMPLMSVRGVDHSSDPVTAEILTKLLKHVMYNNNYTVIQHKAVKLNGIEGQAYFRPKWDALAMNGQGDIKIDLLKPDMVYRDPSGEDNYFIIEKNLTLAEIYRYFPEKASKVAKDLVKDKDLTLSGQKTRALPVQSTDASETVLYAGEDLSVMTQYTRVKYHEVWLKDSSITELGDVENKEEKPKKDEKQWKLKYPYGRWLYIANEKILLDDKACKTKHDPIIPVILDFDPQSDVHGISTIDYVKGEQTKYNEMNSLIMDYLDCTVFPRFKYNPRGTKFNPKKFKNRPGAAIPTMEFEFDRPQPLNNDIFTYMNESKTNIEIISGIHDVTQGRRPLGVTAAEAINLLQESSKTMLRPKARMLEICVKKLGLTCIDLIQGGYQIGRMVRLLGEDIVMNQPEIQQGVLKIKQDLSIGDYDVFVEPDSTLPVSRIERYGMMLDLYKTSLQGQNPIDIGFIIDESGLPNKAEIKQSIMQSNQKAMEAAEADKKAQMELAQQERQTEQAKVDTRFKAEMDKNTKRYEIELRQVAVEEKKLAIEQLRLNFDTRDKILKHMDEEEKIKADKEKKKVEK